MRFRHRHVLSRVLGRFWNVGWPIARIFCAHGKKIFLDVVVENVTFRLLRTKFATLGRFLVAFWGGNEMSAPWELRFFCAHAKKNISLHCSGEYPNSMVGNRICDISAFLDAFWGGSKMLATRESRFFQNVVGNAPWELNLRQRHVFGRILGR